ncbi:MAG: methylmalonyl-CoA mutase family protein, partial [Sciscionella sp.]
AGSYYVESLTDQIARAAQDLVEANQAQGGYIQAQRSGWIRSAVEDSAERWREQVDVGQRRIVGLNCYTTDDAPNRDIFTVDPEVERIAVERVQQLRAERNSATFEHAMNALEIAAKQFCERDMTQLGGDTLMGAAIDAARADATTGEIMGVLKRHLGWGPPHES